jgi:hypothetical protein
VDEHSELDQTDTRLLDLARMLAGDQLQAPEEIQDAEEISGELSGAAEVGEVPAIPALGLSI